MAAAVRSGTCSFIKIADTWLRTVLSVMPSCRAISELRAPSGSGPQRGDQRLVVGVHDQHQHSQVRLAGEQLPAGADPIDAGHGWRRRFVAGFR
jgi:hypothetical protein